MQTSRLFTSVIFYHVLILLKHIQMESFILCLFFIFTLFARNMPILNFIVLSLSIFLSFKESYRWKSTGILPPELQSWTHFGLNTSILPEQKHYTAYRNQEPKQRSNEENILLFHY